MGIKYHLHRLIAVFLGAVLPGVGTAESTALAREVAERPATAQLDQPSGPLAESLVELGDLFNVNIIAPEALVLGKTARAVSGSLTADQALARLLQGSGLSFSRSSTGAYVIARLEQSAQLRDAASELPEDIEEVVVLGLRAERSSTALGIDASLKETPATVNVITREFIDSIQPRSLEEMLQYSPGVSADNQNGTGQGFNIRGFSATTVGNNGGQPVFIGNYRGPGLRYNFDSSLYERIDFLKGTNGILYGTAPPGGIIRFVPRRPLFQSEHRVDTQLGSFDLGRITLDSTGPLNDDQTLAYRIIATASTFNSTAHGRNSDDVFDERQIVKPALTWRMESGGELYLSYEYNKYENIYEPGIPRLPDGTFVFNNGPLTRSDGVLSNTHHTAIAEYSHPLTEDWEVFIGSNYIYTNGTSRWNFSWRNQAGDPDLWEVFQRIRPDQDNEQLEGRAEIRGRFESGENVQHQLKFGVNYYDTERSSFRERIIFLNDVIDPLNPIFPPLSVEPNPDQAFRSFDTALNIYIQDYVSIGESLNVFGGLNYTDGESSRIRSIDGPEETRLSDEALDWSIGFVYNHSPLINPFVSYSTSLMPQAGTLNNGDAVPFRTGEQIEAGWKSELFGGRALFTGSIFQLEQSDIAEGDPSNPGFSILVGDQRTRGLELELVGDITESFSLLAGYSYLDAEFTSSTTGVEGNTPQDVPKHKASLYGQYRFSGDLDGWSFGAGIIHVGERQGNNANSFELPTFERVDLTLGYDRGPYRVHATIENVFDENYVQGSGLGSFASTVAQGAPRFFTLSLSYAFGRE